MNQQLIQGEKELFLKNIQITALWIDKVII